MYYLINLENKQIYGTCNKKPNLNDLSTRNETVFYKEGLEDEEFENLVPIIEEGEVIDINIID
ncbi:MAG: hypothetical protein ACOCRK_01250 [bacterium]